MKNNIIPSPANPDSGVLNTTGSSIDMTRNWWGTTDTGRIGQMMYDTGGVNRILYTPFRLGAVDTAAGADTTAPDAPDTVAVAPSDTSLIVSWSAVTALEEANGGAVGLAGYRVYRSPAISDTSLWTKAAEVGSGVTQWQDTSPFVGKVYYYRVTAFDAASPYMDESFYSDSIPGDSAPYTSQTDWYVNDGSTAGDSYTYATGSDVSGNGSKQTPFASIPKAMSVATSGDTIWIDAGFYNSIDTFSAGSETSVVTVTRDTIALIGKDSNATVLDPPGPKTQSGLYGVIVSGRTGATIRNLGVTGAYMGIRIQSSALCAVDADSACANGSVGIYLLNAAARQNTVTNCVVDGNTTSGIEVSSSASANTIQNNICNSNSVSGIRLTSSVTNTVVAGNTVNSNTYQGIYIQSSDSNTIRHNTVVSNPSIGIRLSSGSNYNVIYQNQITGNDTGIKISDTSSLNLIARNNLHGNTTSNLENAGGQSQTTARNWWGSTDSVAIAAKISDTASAWQPYRLGVVDTAAGADTVAPLAPDTVAASATAGAGTVLVTWSAVTANEDGIAGAAGVAQYRVYRAGVADTSSWTLVGTPTGTSFTDSGMAFGTTYYYRVTARDGAAFPNESYYSDSVAGATPSGFTKAAEPMGANEGVGDYSSIQWGDYDNDGDLDLAVSGRNNNVGGNYYELDIYRNNGGNSFTDVAEPLGANYGLYMRSSVQWGDYDNDGDLDLAVSGYTTQPATAVRLIVYRNDGGGSFTNVAEPLGAGAGLRESSIQWADHDNDGDLDLAVSGWDGTFRRLIIYRNNGAGSFTNMVEPLGANAGVDQGSIQWGDYDNDGDLDLAVSGWDGANHRFIIYRNNGGGSFTNAAEPLGANSGVYLSSIQWGDYDNDGDLDLAVSGAGTANRLVIYRNDGGGSFTNAAEPRGVNAGFIRSSIQWGDYDNDGDLDLAVSGWDGANHRFIIYRNNGGGSFTNAAEPLGANSGVYLSSIQWGDYDNDGDLDLAVSGAGTANRLVIYRNDGGGSFTNAAEPRGVNAGFIRSSIQWGDYDNDGDLDLAVSGDDGSNYRLIVYRNDGGNIFTNAAEPMGANKGVEQGSIHWGDYDNDGDLDLAVSGNDLTRKRLIIYRNDGIASPNQRPSAPTTNYPKGASFAQGDTVAFRWTKVSTDTTPDTGMTYNLRVGTASGKCDIVAADTNSADSVGHAPLGNVQNDTSAVLVKTLTVGQTYYWSVQAVDGAMMRSPWASEETFAVTLAPNTSGEWYVNDASTAGDSFSTAAGSDTSNNGTPTYPYRTITYALSQAKSGDTIYIDAGTYAETVVIDTDNVALIGKDSGAAVIDPPGAAGTAGLYGIYADTQIGLTIKNLGVTGAYNGIRFDNVDLSTLDQDSVSSCGASGIYLLNGSDTNTVSACMANANADNGIYLQASCGNSFGGNTANSNGTDGFEIADNSNNNTFTDNIAGYNPEVGIFINLSSNNIIKRNTTISNSQSGIWIDTGSGNLVSRNLVLANGWSGIGLDNSGANVVRGNEIRGSDTGLYIAGSSSSNYISRNNIFSNNASNILNLAGLAQSTLTRNWFGTADSAAIAAKISDTANAWQPYRLGIVDTAAGADTVAPNDPETVAASAASGAGTVLVTWSAVTANEDGIAGAAGVAQYRVYRAAVADTSSWTLVGIPTGTAFTDSGMTLGTTYYYRVTAWDGATFPNESYYSDSVVSATPTGWTKAAEPMGANAGVYYSSIQWGDYDNDGDLDLAVSGDDGTNKRLIIYRNNGGGSFTNVSEPMGANAGVYYGSIEWGDYDNDGDLDLAVSGTIDNGTNKRLIIYRNNGGGSFTNVSEPMGANAGVYGSSIE
ncbi:MAG: hypothetical protein A3I06_11605, partial [Candidatus Lindowbacteria bacterium RIFCSPLOWO2_02_FULL_62_12]